MTDTYTALKSQIPVCPILGVNIAAVDMDWVLSFTNKHIKELSGQYFCVSNVHTTVTAYKDPSYRSVQNNAIRTMVLKLLAKNVFNMIIYVLRIFFSGFEKPTKLFPVHFRQNQANRYW